MNQMLYLAEHTSNFWAIFPDHRFTKPTQSEPDEDLFLSSGASNATPNQSDLELCHCFTPQPIRGLAVWRRALARAYERPPEARE
jgi:hypothetical protein